MFKVEMLVANMDFLVANCKMYGCSYQSLLSMKANSWGMLVSVVDIKRVKPIKSGSVYPP